MNSIANGLKISMGGYRVLSSGTVISCKNENILFEIDELKVLIKFDKKENTKDYSVNLALIENNTCLQLTLYNFNNSLGTGLTEPFEIGNMKGGKLFLQFIVYTLGESGTRLFSYSWLIKND